HSPAAPPGAKVFVSNTVPSRPFSRTVKLCGVRADNFFGLVGTRYMVRLAGIGGRHFDVAERRQPSAQRDSKTRFESRLHPGPPSLSGAPKLLSPREPYEPGQRSICRSTTRISVTMS